MLAQNVAGASGASISGLTATASVAGTYFVKVERSTHSQQNYSLTALFIPGLLNNEFEPNGTTATATTLSSGIPMTGQISTTTDIDFFKIEASQAGQISVDLKVNTNCGGLSCWTVSILDASNNLLAQNVAGASGANISGLTATATAAATYFVNVERSTHSQQNYSLTTTFP